MAGAMRKMGIYLGLVEDDEHEEEVDYDRYDGSYEDYAEEPASVPARREAGSVRAPASVAAPVRSTWSEDMAVHESELSYDRSQMSRIVTLHPRTYNEARTIGEHFREGVPVIMNLTEMDDSGAKRLVDFAAGLSFGLRGSFERVTNKVFLLSPQDVHVTAEDKARIAEGGFFNQS